MLPIIVTFSGVWMLVSMRGGFFLHPVNSLKCIGTALKRKGAAKSFCLALAGTLGVGNIIGVAVGISVGGAGCVPWMLISCIFSSVLKFAEASLTCENEKSDTGGMIAIIDKTFINHGKALSFIYAALCLFLAFTMGAALQVCSAVECVSVATDFCEEIFLAVILISLMFVIARGVSSIEKFTVIAVPLAALMYICLAFWCIAVNFHKIPSAINSMLTCAFTPSGIGGGAVGIILSKAVSEGYSRGLLSNEAGAGTSTIAHSRNVNSKPCEVGMLGVLEVVFDTVVLCFVTALAVIVSVDLPSEYTSGVSLIMDSVGAALFGNAEILVLLCILVFAFATVVCWYYYGYECYKFLFKTNSRYVYTVLFLLSIICGYFLKVELLVFASDFVLLPLTVVSCATVIKNSGKVKNRAGDIIRYTLDSIPSDASFDSTVK